MRRIAGSGRIISLTDPVLVHEGFDGDTQITCPASEARKIESNLMRYGIAKGAVSQAVGSSPKMVCMTFYSEDADDIADALKSLGYTAIFSDQF